MALAGWIHGRMVSKVFAKTITLVTVGKGGALAYRPFKYTANNPGPGLVTIFSLTGMTIFDLLVNFGRCLVGFYRFCKVFSMF